MSNQLIVRAGSYLVIDSSFTVETGYDLFQMEDNSTLRVQKNIKIIAIEAKFGTNCFIDARGDGAPRGKDASLEPAEIGKQCGDGQNGAAGGYGGTGTNGSSITIQAGLRKFGNLMIDATGGRGGEGGNGQPGGQGGGARCFICLGGHGGNGGDGGTGGSGGDGGKIIVKWTPLGARDEGIADDEVQRYLDKLMEEQENNKNAGLPFSAPFPPGHTYVANGGGGVRGGEGGSRGPGGDGVGCGDFGAQGGGPPGSPGQRGRDGGRGKVVPYEIST